MAEVERGLRTRRVLQRQRFAVEVIRERFPHNAFAEENPPLRVATSNHGAAGFHRREKDGVEADERHVVGDTGGDRCVRFGGELDARIAAAADVEEDEGAFFVTGVLGNELEEAVFPEPHRSAQDGDAAAFEPDVAVAEPNANQLRRNVDEHVVIETQNAGLGGNRDAILRNLGAMVVDVNHSRSHAVSGNKMAVDLHGQAFHDALLSWVLHRLNFAEPVHRNWCHCSALAALKKPHLSHTNAALRAVWLTRMFHCNIDDVCLQSRESGLACCFGLESLVDAERNECPYVSKSRVKRNYPPYGGVVVTTGGQGTQVPKCL